MSDLYLGRPERDIRIKCKKMYPNPNGKFCFMAEKMGDGASVALVTSDNSASWCHLQYSTDSTKTWNTYSGLIVYLDSCEDAIVFFRADPANPNTDGFYNGGIYHNFVIEKAVAAFGNIQYLLTSDGKRTDVPTNCYSNMFKGCTSLTQAPQLPATTLANSCYNSMFSGCTSLTQATLLPATTLANNCYSYMFNNCPKFSDCHMKASMQGVYNTSTHGDTTKTVIYDL